MTWIIFREFIFSKRAGSLIRRIAWLSMISIGISVTAFLIVLFVMQGMNQSIEKRILSLEPHLSLRFSGISSSKMIPLHPAAVKLTEMENVQVSHFESQDVVLRSADGQFRGAIARGISTETMRDMQKRLDNLNKLKKSYSAFLERWSPDEIPGSGEVAIGADLARSLRVSEGDFLTVIPPESLLLPLDESPKFETVKIRKVIYTNLADIDGGYLFYERGKALRHLQNDSSRQQGLEVWVPDLADVNELKAELEKFEGVAVETWIERNSDLFFALRIEKIIIGIFLGLAALLSASSIVGVLSLLIFQKRKEIKILRTVGLSNKATLKTFLKVGLLLSLSGVFVGALIGTGAGLYIQENPLNILPDIYYDTQIPAIVDPALVIFVLLVGVVVGFFGSYIPAKKVAYDEIGKI